MPFCFPPLIEGFQIWRSQAVNRDEFNPPIDSKDPVYLAIFGDNCRIHVVMRRKALCQQNIHRFQLVLVSLLIYSIVSFSARQDFQPSDERDLKKLAAIILKNITDTVLGGEVLIPSNVRK